MSIMKVELIDEWQKFYKLYSVWAYVIISVSPDIYNVLVEYGYLQSQNTPSAFSEIVKILCVAGIIVRLIKQKKQELDATNQTAT